MSHDDKNRRLFIGCFVGLVATAFGFMVRASVLGDLTLPAEQLFSTHRPERDTRR